MKKLRISITLTAFLVFWAYDFSGRALADDFIDGILAYDNGDYEKALTHL